MGYEHSSIKPAIKIVWTPPLATLALLTALVAVLLIANQGNPLRLIQVGSRYGQEQPGGTIGYDGQFNYYIAEIPNPAAVTDHLDVPAYRYQRILLPLLVSLLSLGNHAVVPWLLILAGILFQTAGTWFVASILDTYRINRWYALIYGAWPGFLFSASTGLSEPLAFGLVAAAVYANLRQHNHLSWVLLGLSLFAKEETMGFVLAAGLQLLFEKRWRDFTGFALIAGLPYLLFQVWLWRVFGHVGIGSGGAYATPFEIIPFMGALRLLANPYWASRLSGVILIPVVIFPALWAVQASLKKLFSGDTRMAIWVLLLNSIVLVVLPYSTYDDMMGIGRFLCALILAALLFYAQTHEGENLFQHRLAARARSISGSHRFKNSTAHLQLTKEDHS